MAEANTVVSKLSGNVCDERQDYAVLESRPTDNPIPIPDCIHLLSSTDYYFGEVNEHMHEFFAKNGITQNGNDDFSKSKRT